MAGRRNILVLGGTGQLGTALVRLLESRGIGVTAPGRDELDLATADLETAITAGNPRAVINAAAYNDVTAAEDPRHHAAALRLNRDVPGALARVCRMLELPLIHVSTDYVFDGTARRAYREDDLPAPLQFYGRSKLEGEYIALREYEHCLVARTSTVFGRDRRQGSNYVDAILRQARKQERLEVVRLPVASPTYAPDLALALLTLLEARVGGLVHVANLGQCSRLELARETVRLAGLAGRVEVRERAPALGGPDRPAYAPLDTTRLARSIGRSLRPWQEALAEYIASPPDYEPS